MKYEKINVGRLIKDEVKRQKMTFSSFANSIGIKRQNVESKVFSNETLDTGLLIQISEALSFDFFKHYRPIGQVEEARNENDYKRNSIKEVKACLTLQVGEEAKEETFCFTFGKEQINKIRRNENGI